MPYEIEGLDKTLAALRKLSPEIYKEMQTEIRPALKTIVKDAKGFLPQELIGLRTGFMKEGEAVSHTNKSRGFPRYNFALARKGMGYSMGKKRTNQRGWVSLYSVFNRNAAAMIIETAGAGRKPPKPNQSNNPNARAYFKETVANDLGSFYKIEATSSRRGRILFRATAKDYPMVINTITDAVNKACIKISNQLPNIRKAA